MWANRNGFFYVLDRPSGEFLLAKNFVKQNWAVGIDEKGKPIKEPSHWPKPIGGSYTEPGTQGGTNWYPPSFSPRTGLIYIPTWENSGAQSAKGDPGPWVEGERYTGNGRDRAPDGSIPRAQYRQAHGLPPVVVAGRGGGGRGPGRASSMYKKESEGYGAIRAIDPKTGEKVWDFKMVDYTRAACFRRLVIWCSAAAATAASPRSTLKPASSSGMSSWMAPTPAALSATLSTASSTLSAPEVGLCIRSHCRISGFYSRRRWCIIASSSMRKPANKFRPRAARSIGTAWLSTARNQTRHRCEG